MNLCVQVVSRLGLQGGSNGLHYLGVSPLVPAYCRAALLQAAGADMVAAVSRRFTASDPTTYQSYLCADKKERHASDLAAWKVVWARGRYIRGARH